MNIEMKPCRHTTGHGNCGILHNANFDYCSLHTQAAGITFNPPPSLPALPLATGTKYDTGKAPMSLIPPEAEEAEALVWGFGAKKYAAHNFRKGLLYSQILSGIKRHTNAIVKGEDIDPDSGLPHAAHIRCGAAMLIVLKDRKDLDDRWKQETNKE